MKNNNDIKLVFGADPYVCQYCESIYPDCKQMFCKRAKRNMNAAGKDGMENLYFPNGRDNDYDPLDRLPD